MKRFLLFSGDDHYPSGGWGDLFGDFDSAAEAFGEGRKHELKGKWFHVVDLQLGKEIDLQEAQVTAG